MCFLLAAVLSVVLVKVCRVRVSGGEVNDVAQVKWQTCGYSFQAGSMVTVLVVR